MMNGTWDRKAFLTGAALALAMTITLGNAQTALAQALPPLTKEGAYVQAVARAAFDALPEADRRALQDGLIWTGHYTGVADGTFGRQTFEAIAAYQQGSGKPASGILNPADRQALQMAAQRAKIQAGFQVVDDPKTGVQIGVPLKVLPKQDANPSGGSRWQSQDDAITLDTRTATTDATLKSLYDRNITIKTPGRVVTYKVLRPDFFVIAGETPTGKFYMRYAGGADGIRAFSVGYDKALAAQFDRMVVAIANSFTPFPTAAAPDAVAQDFVPAPQMPSPSAPQARGLPLIGTGLTIGSRQVVTTAPVRTCKDVRVLGLKPQQIRGNSVFALDFGEDLKAQSAALAEGNVTEGSPLLVVAFADEGATPSLIVASGLAASESNLAAPLESGASGAPIFDERHGFVGLVGPVSSSQRRIAGVMPTASYGIVPVSELIKSYPELIRNGPQPAARKASAADLVMSVQGALVPIICAS